MPGDLIPHDGAREPELLGRAQAEDLQAYIERVERWIDDLEAMGTNTATNVANWMIEGREVGAFARRMRADLVPKQRSRITAGNQLAIAHRYEVDVPSGKIRDWQTGKLEEYDPAKHQHAIMTSDPILPDLDRDPGPAVNLDGE